MNFRLNVSQYRRKRLLDSIMSGDKDKKDKDKDKDKGIDKD